MLGHRDFEASARTRDFLRFVVEEALAGRSDRLKGYAIAIEVFGRAPDFDPNLDPIVRIQAGRLRRALEHYYLVAGGHDPVVISMPRGGYAPEFSLNSGGGEPATRPAESSFDAVTKLPPGVGVAVLPLRELSDGVESRAFAEGLREELCHELSRYQDLAVVPCSREILADRGLAGHGELSCRLGTRFLLEGSVRRGDARIKVSAWQVDGPSGRQIWSESYSCPASPDHLIATQE